MKNMDDVRQLLVEEIKALREKRSNPATANAIFNGVGKILSTVKLELEHSRYVKKLEGALPLTMGLLTNEPDADKQKGKGK